MGSLEMVHRGHELAGIGQEFEACSVVQDPARVARRPVPPRGTVSLGSAGTRADRAPQTPSGGGVRSLLQRRDRMDSSARTAPSGRETRDARAMGGLRPAIETPGAGTRFEDAVPPDAQAERSNRDYRDLISRSTGWLFRPAWNHEASSIGTSRLRPPVVTRTLHSKPVSCAGSSQAS